MTCKPSFIQQGIWYLVSWLVSFYFHSFKLQSVPNLRHVLELRVFMWQNLSWTMNSTRLKVTYLTILVLCAGFAILVNVVYTFVFWNVLKFEPIYDISASCTHLQIFETSISTCSSPVAFITTFVTMFALVIAITKDLPDVEGDRK